MKAGALNRHITIERRQTGTDAAGQPLDGWELVASVWADVRGPTGMGAITRAQGGVPASIDAYSFRIRYLAGLDAGMRVVLDGQPFDIRQVRMDHAHREWTDLVCEAGGNAG